MLISFETTPPFELDYFIQKHGPRRKRRLSYYKETLQMLLVAASDLVEPAAIIHTFTPAELPQISPYLPSAEKITLAVCSIGAKLDAEASARFQDEPLEGLMLDQIGAEWISSIARELYGRLRQQTQANGLKVSPSYRPGIGKWPLSLQKEIGRQLPLDSIGISLNDSFIMIPAKSISMIVAQGSQLPRSKFAPIPNNSQS